MAFKSNNRGFLVAVLLVAAAAELVGNAAATTYVVGDSLGWNVPRTTSDYTSWASQHVFRVGDVLVFNFMTNLHDVAQVTKAAYDSCASTTPILLGMTGPWNTTLTTAGDYYYICTFNGHCGLGQKLAINVAASSPSPSPSLTPAPAPAPAPSVHIAPTPAPTPSGSPSPAPGTGLAPSPAPGAAGVTPPPSPGPMGLAPASDGLIPPPPPPPNSAMVSTISAPVIGFTLLVFGFMI